MGFHFLPEGGGGDWNLERAAADSCAARGVGPGGRRDGRCGGGGGAAEA